jgi:uncharacterized protein YjbI with pentapeptide repeats
VRGIKPYKAGLLTRPFEWNRTYQLGISAFLYFPFEPAGSLLTDLELWDFAASALPSGTVLDMGVPKSRSEFLIIGSAFQPGGRPAAACAVKAEIGALKKTLFVIGDRDWKDEVPSEPKPFLSMPLSWANAFGGAGFAKNPLGKGIAPIEVDGRRFHPLPNVEAPGALVTAPGEKPAPQSFAPIDFTWPQRFSLAGTYDKAWFDNLYPGFAPDMDWRIWNAAPENQRQEDPFRGDERLFFKNLHPTKAELTAHLPRARCRAFVVRAGKDELEEVPLRLTTIWAFPDQERGVVIFQGGVKVLEDDAHDISVVMIAVERMGEPRDMANYRAAYEKRIDPERVAETLDETDLVPADLAGFGPEVARQTALTTPKGYRAQLLKALGTDEIARVRKELELLGLDPDEHGPKLPPEDTPPPGPAELARMAQEKREEAELAREEAAEKQAELLEEFRPLYKEKGLDFEELQREVNDPPPGGPPEPMADKVRDGIVKLASDMEAIGHPVDELGFYLEDPKFYEGWKKDDADSLEAYRGAAHLQGPARVLPERAQLARERVIAAIEAGESLRERDLTGVDLSELALPGVDLTRALLEKASLRGTDLSGAKLDGAVLAHADLSGATLTNASCVGTNLGRANLGGVSAEKIDLRQAILYGAVLDKSYLARAKLDQATLMEASFAGTDLSHSTGRELLFYKSRLSSTKLVGVNWTAVVFTEVEAEGIDLSGCTMTDATFLKWRGANGKFVNANLRGGRWVMECSLDGSDFKGATLDESSMRGLKMRRADFSGAKLNRCDLSEALLEESKLYRIVARDSMWVRADLRKAQLVSADLFNAILQKADLRGADLRGANLYGADFALIRGDKDTRIEDAIMDKVRARPRRPETRE